MVEVVRETETDKVEGTLLGQRVSAPTTYSPEILVRVPRSENRDQYGITNSLFVGQDHWYAYECSTLTSRGVPVYFGMVIEIPSDSKYIVESKSLKLYLNSYNMHSWDAVTPDDISTRDHMINQVGTDLAALLECRVIARAFGTVVSDKFDDLAGQGFDRLGHIVDFSKITTKAYQEDPSLLKITNIKDFCRVRLSYDGFRSNCKVTHQPDYANVFIHLVGRTGIDPESLAKYLMSFRNENHFHEECVELIFKRLTDVYQPTHLFVRANYTRRGGIDINPSRYSAHYQQAYATHPPSMTIYQ